VKVLVVGNGGREHALAGKLLQSPQVEQVVCGRLSKFAFGGG
jgi:phosphoribosylamine---glycine ligase